MNPHPGEHLFSEKREWTYCAACQGRRATSGGLEPCEECGQPPRCVMGAHPTHDRCDRIATVEEMSGFAVCGQDHLDMRLIWQRDEARYALEALDSFMPAAEFHDNEVLTEFMEAAREGIEARMHSLEAEREAIWNG